MDFIGKVLELSKTGKNCYDIANDVKYKSCCMQKNDLEFFDFHIHFNNNTNPSLYMKNSHILGDCTFYNICDINGFYYGFICFNNDDINDNLLKMYFYDIEEINLRKISFLEEKIKEVRKKLKKSSAKLKKIKTKKDEINLKKILVLEDEIKEIRKILRKLCQKLKKKKNKKRINILHFI
jgi:hypothetical protein